MLTLKFDHPEFLLLGLLAIPLLILGWRALAMTDSLRRAVILGMRTIVLLALAAILAGPRLVKQHDHLTVIGLLDISGSVQRFADLPPVNELFDSRTEAPASTTQFEHKNVDPNAATAPAGRHSNIEYLRQWFRKATQIKEPDDRFGLLVFDGRAIAISAPTKAKYIDDNLDVSIAQGTNIEDAVRLGLAMFPPDTAKRLVLVTDGNETAGNVMEAVKRLGGRDDLATPSVDFASTSSSSSSSLNPLSDSSPTRRVGNPIIPIDVLPIAYRVTRDVQVVRIEAPATAQPGQTVTVRIVLESTAPVAGSLTLKRESQPIDLNGEAPGASRHVQLPAGQSVQLAEVALGETPINRFEASFESDDPRDNILPDNDRAEAFTATPSKGSVLVLDSRARQRENGLAQILTAAGIPNAVRLPAQLPDDLLSLQNFDLIVLDNIGAYEIPPHQQELLARYVNDLGGGLIMTGGENSFGAGGWKGSPIASLLPVNLEPSKELRLPSAALVLVLDKSGSMNQAVAGARATQQEVANEGAALAIESLRSDNLVGVITFDMFAYTLVPLQQNNNPKKLAEKVRSITADGGTNIEAALEKSFDMIRNAKVAKKRVVFMTDGRSSSTANLEQIVKQMAAADIQLTTIAVGDDADYDLLEKLAKVGGGSFYPVRDPRILPRVLIDSVQVINKPLIKEITFTPRVLPTGSTLTAGMGGPAGTPPLEGLVITSMRDDPKVNLEMVDADNEPLLAHWQAGLGKVAAFTSEIPGDVSGWADQWIEWPTASTFWTQLARTISRPAMNQDAELITNIRDDKLNITFDMTSALDQEQGAALDYLQVNGTVYRPDGTTQSLRLRQTAPGRYEASTDATLAGNYIVALNPRQGTRQLPPAIGGANRSTSPEFRRYSSNLALLEQIVQSTGGRRLDIGDPLAKDLFDRTGMPPSVSSLPAWRTILFWALALLLLDVASRRIAWDSIVLRNLLARAMARITPARVRSAQTAATLATLRRASDEAEMRRELQSAGVEKFKATGVVAPPPDRDVFIDLHDDAAAAMRRAEGGPETSHYDGTDEGEHLRTHKKDAHAAPDESKVSAALDALFDRAKPKSPSHPTSSSPPETKATKSDASETARNLLAAKRRARERLQDSTGSDSPKQM